MPRKTVRSIKELVKPTLDAITSAAYAVYNDPKTSGEAKSYASHLTHPSKISKLMQQYSATQEKVIHSQLLYLLGNIQHWRGPNSTEIRQVFRDYVDWYDANLRKSR